MIDRNQAVARNGYREAWVRSTLVPIGVALLVVAVPLGWLNWRIHLEGSNVSDFSRYELLIESVVRDVELLNRMQGSETVDELELLASSTPGSEIVSATAKSEPEDRSAEVPKQPLRFVVNGIYWQANKPVATINGETCMVGDVVLGFRVVEIHRTRVVLQGPGGAMQDVNFREVLNGRGE